MFSSFSPRRLSLCFVLAVVLAGLTAAPALATFPGLNGRIAYTDTSGSGGTGFDVWSMLPDGTSRQQLTNNPANDQGPGWSPDGTKIAFSSTRTGSGDIYVMNADGSNQTQLTNASAQETRPSWSPDGTKIAYTRRDPNNGPLQIWVMNADGSGQTQLTFGAPGSDSYGEDWSPDGTHLAYSHEGGSTQQGIWTMNADGSGQTRIFDGSVGYYYSPSYSPDGTRIACECAATADVATMNTDGSNYRQLTTSGNDGAPAWSPDGTKIAYEQGSNVWEMNPDGSGQTQITTDLTGLGGLRWQTLPPPPTATTGAASGVTASSATLNGTVNPRHYATTYHFEYGTSTAYGSRTAEQSAGSDATDHSESASIAGLAPNTTYHFRIVATSEGGTTYGADQTFTTASPPLATTGAASNVGATAATLTGTVTPQGSATTYHFQYGLSKNYGKTTTTHSAGAGTSKVSVRFRVTGLRPGAIYHYRLVATNASGTVRGKDRTFRTKAVISVAGLSTSGCMRLSTRSVLIRVRSLLGVRTTVKLGSRTVGHGARTLRLRLAHLGAGAHTLRVTSTGKAGTTTRTVRFAICRSTAPKFTG